MSCCAHCKATDAHFGLEAAQRDLERYRERGPDGTARLMLEAIGEFPVRGSRLLDIGAGIGAIHHELLGTAIARATHVEAASAFVRVAREEDGRRGVEQRVEYVLGDAVELSDGLPTADLVTLDRVICCYPDWAGLVRVSASKAVRLRTFVHPVGEIERMLVERGFRRVALRRTIVWHVALYAARETAL